MKISKDAARASRQLMRACIANGRLHPSRVRNVVKRLMETKPRSYLQILSAFQRLVRLEIEKRRALIETAERLSPALETQLRNDLKKKYGEDLEMEFVINPELIGGLRVKVGSHVWDGSVRGRIEALRHELA
jgi:F-type H+-transporting ATPase subunit delta